MRLVAPPRAIAALGAAAAVLAPTLMWVEFIATGLSRPGYSLILGAASDLGAVGTPGADAFVAGFFVLPGLFTIVLGTVLQLSQPAVWMWRAGACLVVVDGLLLILAGAVRMDPFSAATTQRHQAIATACFAAAAAAPLLLAAGSRVRWPVVPQARWFVLGALLVGLLAIASLLRLAAGYPDGIFQRPFGVLLTVWYLDAAAWLARSATQHRLRGGAIRPPAATPSDPVR